MLFEEKRKNLEIENKSEDVQVRIDLEPKRENNLQVINEVYSKEVFNEKRKLGRTKLIKIAIDNFINDLEELSEEEALQYVRSLYKEAEF